MSFTGWNSSNTYYMYHTYLQKQKPFIDFSSNIIMLKINLLKKETDKNYNGSINCTIGLLVVAWKRWQR